MKTLLIATLLLASATSFAKENKSHHAKQLIVTKQEMTKAKDRGLLSNEDYCTEALAGTYYIDGRKEVCILE